MLWCNGAATCFLRWDKPALYPLRRPNRSMSTESRPTADFVADAVKSQSPLPNSLSTTYLLCKDFLGVNYVWCYQTNVLKQQDKENLRRSTESHLRRCFLAPSLWFFAKVRTGSLEEMPTSARGQLASTLTIRGRVEPHRTAPFFCSQYIFCCYYYEGGEAQDWRLRQDSGPSRGTWVSRGREPNHCV